MGEKIKKLQAPLTEKDVRSLKAGDEVSLSGVVYAARDMAHKRLCELIDANKPLPFEIEGAIIYFVGPTPAPVCQAPASSDASRGCGRQEDAGARPGKVIGAAGPTTSSRMDPFSPKLLAKGLKAMIGKGYRGAEVREALKKYTAVHLSTIGGAGALLSKQIVAAEVIAYEDLGTESIRKLQVIDFPAIVAYDSHGGTLYK